jgi:hypothetical protein
MIEPLILAAFSFFNALRVFSYLPQIVRIARDTGGAAAVSYVTWSLWLCANLSTAAYAGAIVGDVALCLISSVNTLCCGIVICLTMYKRRGFRAAAKMIAASWAPYPTDCLLRLTARRRAFPRIIPHIAPPPG